MKNLFPTLVFALILLGLVFSCNKDNNNYEVADYTRGMLESRRWQGRAYGYIKGDTLIPPATDSIDWPKYYYRNMDTTFALSRVNAFVLDVAGKRVKFLSIDSNIKRKEFDSTYANSARTLLVYDWGKDSMYFEYHRVGEHNSAAGRAYEDNIYLISDK